MDVLRRILLSFILLATVLGSFGVAQAEPKDQIDIRQFSPFPKGTTIRSLLVGDPKTGQLATIPNFLIAFVGFTFLVFFLINAFRYLIGSGNTESTTAAKNGMLSAIIGLIVSITAYGVIFVASKWIGQ